MMEGRSVQMPRTFIYPHEQCLVAFAQWTRMMECTRIAKSKTSDQTRGSSGLPRRQSVDPGLARLVQTEWMNRTGKGGTQSNNNTENSVLDCSEVLSIETGDRQSAVSPQRPSKDSNQLRELDEVSPSSHCGQTPWKKPEKCYSTGLQGLHEEIDDFYAYMRPWSEEQWMRDDIIAGLNQLVLELWSTAEVKVYGSFKTDLYLPTSDIDLVVMCDDVDSQTALKMLEQKLIEKNAYDDVKVIKTSVPIVKFTDRKTAVKVDVSFNVQTGISSADFIKSKMGEFPELPYLVLVLKQFLLCRNLLESFNGGISSYCLILLIISYLQLHPDDRKTGNHGDMLIKFLELYGRHFNFLRTGIRINNGGSYFRKNENEGELGNRFSLLCIEDPFNPANDVGQGCYGAMKVREEFDKAYRELCDAVLPQYQHIQPIGSSFLGRILLLPVEVIQYRQLIKDKYHDYVVNHLPSAEFESLASVAEDNRSDDSASTCSQTSNLSSEQQTTKSSSSSSSSGSSTGTSPGSNIPSETESDVQSDGTKHLTHHRSQVKYNQPPVESNLDTCHVDSDLFGTHQQLHHPISVIRMSTSPFPHPSQPPLTIMLDPTPVPLSHTGHHTSGRSNSWHNTTRSQGQKSSQRPAATSAAAAATTNIGNPPGSKTYVQTARYNSERRRKNGRYENNSSGAGTGGSGYGSGR